MINKKTILCAAVSVIAITVFSFCFVASAEEFTIAEIIAELEKTIESRLNLTPAQRAEITAQIENQKAARKVLATNEKAKKEALELEMSKEVVDADVVNSLIDELNAIRGEVLDLKIETTQKIKEVLTITQRDTLKNIKDKHLIVLVEEEVEVGAGEVVEEVAEKATIVIYSIECDSEASLPNWTIGPDRGVNKMMLDTFIDENPTCHYSSGWKFQYGDQTASINSSAFLGEALGYIGTVGPTVGDGGIKIQDIDIEGITQFRIRIVWKSGWHPFTDDNGNPDSSEFYCNDNTLGFNNKETIDNPQAGGYYTCVLLTVAE